MYISILGNACEMHSYASRQHVAQKLDRIFGRQRNICLVRYELEALDII